jgi:uncharacterized protein YecT (DUF1311 family)
VLRLVTCVACILALSGSLARTLRAQAVHLPRAEAAESTPCDRDSTQADINACSAHHLRLSRARLDLLLRILRDSLRPSARPGLARTEQRWEAYARAQCRWELDGYGGASMGAAESNECLAAEIEKRIDTLKPSLCGFPPYTQACDATEAFDRAAWAIPRRLH